MGKNQSASGLTNIVQYDNDGNISLVSGSTTLLYISSSGAITTRGIISGSNALSASYAISASNAISGAYAVNATTASYAVASTTASYSLTGTSASYAASASNTLSSSNAIIAQTASSADNFLARGTITAQTIVVQTITSSQDFVTGSTRFGSIIGNTHQFTGSVNITGSLLSNGAIGIGTTSPTSGYSLDVNGASYFRSTTVITGSGGTYLNIRTSGSDAAVFCFDGVNTGYVGLNVGSNPNKFVIYYAAATRMAIDTSGNVGFGTASPSYNLEVSSGSASPTELAITNTNAAGAARLSLRNAERNFIVTSNTTDDLLSFSYDGSNRLQFNTTNQWFNSGNVGIGTTNPYSELHTVASGGGDNMGLTIENSGAGGAKFYIWPTANINGEGANRLIFSSATNANILVLNGSTSAATFSGNVGIGINPSYRLDVSSGASGVVLNLEGTNAYNAETGILMSSGRAKISGFLNGSGGTPGTSLRFYTMPDGGSVTERIRIDSSGNVGIGITAPNRKLHVYGTATVFDGMLLENSNSNAFTVYQSKTGNSSTWQWGTWNDNSYRVGVSGVADYITIASSGRVGIGTTTPDAGLQVAQPGQDDQLTIGSIANNRDHAAFMCSGANKAEILRYQSGVRLMIASSGAIANVDVLPGGSVGVRLNAGNTSWSAFTSDERKKKNFETVPGLEAVMQINPVKYHFKTQEDSDIKKLGFIAQNIQSLIPEMVHPNGEKAEDGSDILTIIPDYILPVLVKSIQELNTKLDAANAEIEALKLK